MCIGVLFIAWELGIVGLPCPAPLWDALSDTTIKFYKLVEFQSLGFVYHPIIQDSIFYLSLI